MKKTKKNISVSREDKAIVIHFVREPYSMGVEYINITLTDLLMAREAITRQIATRMTEAVV